MASKKVISSEQLDEVIAESEQHPVVIFKHSPRCSISALALSRFENTFQSQEYYLIDVVSQRELSQNIAAILRIMHESPQLLLLSKKHCIYHASHLSISARELELTLRKLGDN